ncbi:DUF7674 family protein [Paenibacillus sp. FSL R7-0331]|uniref:DUF7674 family protein n=1 Tax=Paenibacillus sp. FSL R7-0331 TaxID=1536773 RepID=UPI0004F6A7D3|nr:hypothetical protein [Paenibacillus sp. FSL R7-0331]AIQ50690.1 hypothetical protein R70331_03475 [Paenibacillus sp. FSL R7-0331]
MELFYDIRGSFTGKEDTIYTLMVQLRSRVKDAHLKKDTDELDKIYGYVEWCFNQRKRCFDLCNAAAVGFYEHLVEEEITRHAIPYRVKLEIFEQVQPLFEWMLEREAEKYEELVLEYNRVNHTAFEC